MAERAYATLNGEAQSWANITANVAIYDGPSLDCSDISAVSWENAIERGTQRFPNGQIKAYTHGQSTPTGKIQFYADGAQGFREKLIDVAIAKGYVDNGEALYGSVVFDINIMHTPMGATSIRQVELLGCQLAKDAADHAEGTDPDKNEFELHIKSIVRTVNGKRARLL